MIFTHGENTIEYSIISSEEAHADELDLLFKVGRASEVVYITSIEMADASIKELTATLHAFCTALNTQRIVYSITNTSSAASNTITRYALQAEGFKSFARFIDDAEATLFMYWNSAANEVFTRLFDEYIGFELHDMVCDIADGDKSRIDRVLDTLGATDADALLKYISLYLSKGTTPQPMTI